MDGALEASVCCALLVIVDGRWGDGLRDPSFINGAVAIPG